MVDWALMTGIYLVHSARGSGTMLLVRWRREYNPDLVFVTKTDNQIPLPVTRGVLEDFRTSAD